MIYKKARFSIRKDKLEEAWALSKVFIDLIAKKE